MSNQMKIKNGLIVDGYVNIVGSKEYQVDGYRISPQDVSFQQDVGGILNISDLKSAINNVWSSTSISGFNITKNGDGSVDVSSGEVILRPDFSPNSELKAFPVSAISGLVLVDNDENYVIVDYNEGNPDIKATTIISGTGRDKLILFSVYRRGTTLYVKDMRQQAVDGINRIIIKSIATKGFEHVTGSSVLSEVGTRNINLTSGAFYFGVTRLTHSEFNTSVSDTFSYLYQDGTGGWNEVTNQTQINNTNYDDGSGTLAETTGYGVHLVFVIFDSVDKIHIVYGQDNYETLADAQAAEIPSILPGWISALCSGVLVGKIIIGKDQTVFADIQTPFIDELKSSIPVSHNHLADIQGGVADERLHLSNTEHTIATQASTATVSGYLTSTDWATFNGKSDYVDPLTTRGDLLYVDSVGTARLGLGLDGYVLTSDGYDVIWKELPEVHNPVTLNQTAIDGGLSLSDQEISFRVASALYDGYLSATDWNTFNNKEPSQTKGTISSDTVSVLTVTNGANSTVGPNVSIEINKASSTVDGYLGKDDWTTFNGKSNYVDPLTTRGDLLYVDLEGDTARLGLGSDGYVLTSDGYDVIWKELPEEHDPVTLNQTAIDGGLSLNDQEISFRAASALYDGYLKSSDWTTFNSKEPAVTKGDLTSNTTSVISISDGTGAVIGTGTSITINKASSTVDGYLGKDDWATFNGKSDYVDPLTTRGDLLYVDSGEETARLGLGLDGYVLTSDGGDVVWKELLGGGTLDYAYNFGGVGAGREIIADSGAVEITVTDASNNAGLIINQNDTTNNLSALVINNSGTGASISSTNLTFESNSSTPIPFNSASPDNELVGFTSDSIVGSLNELKEEVSSGGVVVEKSVNTGTEEIDSFSDLIGKAAFWNYVVSKGANLRAGTITACWDQSSNSVVYTEQSTIDIGDTSDISFSVDINTDNVRLLSTSLSNGWDVKVSRKIL